MRNNKYFFCNLHLESYRVDMGYGVWVHNFNFEAFEMAKEKHLPISAEAMQSILEE
ncbi:hypothetical protein LLG39_13865 [bacterium]|nr:hypothetical protein [bacterium]